MKKVGEEGNNVTDENVVEPNVLYKYCAFNEYTEKIFTHNDIHFSSPGEFNDPFDSKVRLICDNTRKGRKHFLRKFYQKKYPERSRKEMLAAVKKIMEEGKDTGIVRETLELSRERLRKELGICCFSEKRDDILMWAHYAEQHTGLCLEFDVDNEFFATQTRTLKVEYETTLPELDVLRMDTYPKRKIGEKLLIKANDWKYEKEWRIVDHMKGPGIQNFPEDALSGVILGCRISQENKENIFRWCGKRKSPPTLYEAREKQKEFGLDIVKIDY